MTATGVVADDIERLSLVMRTDRWSGAGDTVVRVRAIPEGIIGEELVVDPVGAAQIVTVVSVQDRDITITPALGATLEPDTAVIRKQFAEFITSGAQMSLAADASATDLTVTVKSKLTGLQPRAVGEGTKVREDQEQVANGRSVVGLARAREHPVELVERTLAETGGRRVPPVGGPANAARRPSEGL